MKNKDKVVFILDDDFDKFLGVGRKEKKLKELNKKIKEQEVFLHQAKRYSPEILLNAIDKLKKEFKKEFEKIDSLKKRLNKNI